MHLIATNPTSARVAFADLDPETPLHGLTDGSWSMIDGILDLLRKTGPAHLVISTWTAGSADLRHAHRLLKSSRIKSIRLLVDRSFLTRQPDYCDAMRKRFGDESIRCWSSHAKFVILHGGSHDVLYLTSANFNQNKRLENFSVFMGGQVPAQYLDLVNRMFDIQQPGQGFATPAVARPQMDQALSHAPQDKPRRDEWGNPAKRRAP